MPFTALPCNIGTTLPRNISLDLALPSIKKALGVNPYDCLIIDEPLLYGIWKKIECSSIIYRPTDIYSSGVRAAAQQRILAVADAVVCTSQVVLDSLNLRDSKPTLVLENGVDYERFVNVMPRQRSSRKLVYVGAVDERFDWQWLETIARILPAVSLYIYGPITVPIPKELPANILLRGPISYDDVPNLLAEFKVGLLPFKGTKVNTGRSPMKLYEFLAAGLHVIGTAVNDRKRPQEPPLGATDDPLAAAALITSALRQNPNSAGQNLAKQFDWSARARLLLQFTQEVVVTAHQKANRRASSEYNPQRIHKTFRSTSQRPENSLSADRHIKRGPHSLN